MEMRRDCGFDDNVIAGGDVEKNQKLVDKVGMSTTVIPRITFPLSFFQILALTTL